MDNIKIVRLQNGEDIVGTVISQDDDQFTICEPMKDGIQFKNNESGLIMNHWLPVQLLKKNEAVISTKDIMCVFEPLDDLCEFYVNSVEKIKKLLKARDIMDDLDDIESLDIMEALDELKYDGHNIH